MSGETARRPASWAPRYFPCGRVLNFSGSRFQVGFLGALVVFTVSRYVTRRLVTSSLSAL